MEERTTTDPYFIVKEIEVFEPLPYGDYSRLTYLDQLIHIYGPVNYASIGSDSSASSQYLKFQWNLKQNAMMMRKMQLIISSAKCRSFCLSLIVLEIEA